MRSGFPPQPPGHRAHVVRQNASAPIEISPWRRHAARLLIAWSLLSPTGLVWAGPVADAAAAASQRPILTATPSGIPLINITTPNAAGQSYNRYEQLGSDTAGLIFNNSRVAGVNAFGEQLPANPNLRAQSAKDIINEVSRGLPSRFDGPLAIFGDRARLIIINPNGITCNGCGFINTQGVTFSTGTPRWLDAAGGDVTDVDTASALAFEVRGGRIEITGRGLSSPLDQLDLIAQTLRIDAPIDIGSGALNLIAGRQRVDFDRLTRLGSPRRSPLTPLDGNDQATSEDYGEDYAIDASLLGAMRAGQIRLIATAAGLGVRSDSTLAASSGDLQISAQGELTVKRLEAARDIHLHTPGNITQGGMDAGRDLSIEAARLDNREQTLLAHGDARITLTDSHADTFANRGGQILAGHTLTLALNSADIDLTAPGSGQFSGTDGLALSARTIRNSGRFTQAAALSLKASDSFSNSGTVLAGGDLELDAGTLINSGLIAALNDARVDVRVKVNNVHLPPDTAGGDPSRTTGGTLYAGHDLSLGTPMAGAFGGTVAAERDLDLRFERYTHGPGETDFTAGRDLTVTAIDLTSHDTLQAPRDLALNLSGTLDNRDLLLAGQDMAVRADTLNNRGGVIEARRDLELSARTLNNDGQRQRTTTVAYDLPGYVNQVLTQVDDPVIQQKLFNELGPDWVDKNSRTTLLNRHVIFLDRDTSIQRIELSLDQVKAPATLSAGRHLNAQVSGTLANNASLITAGGDITLSAADFANRAGQDSYIGRIDAGGGYHFLGAYRNASATVQAGGALTVDAATQRNSGNLEGHRVWLGGTALTNGLTDYQQPTPATALPPTVTPLTVPRAGQHFTPGAPSLFTSTARLSLLLPGALNDRLPETLRNTGHPFLLDAPLEQQALREAALRQTGKASFLGMNDPAQERARLYDNAARFASAQNIPLGVKLSPEQIARLSEPILWYATQTVTGTDGQPYRVLVPQVYLSDSAQMDRAHRAGGLIQGETVTLDMRERVHNTGYIAAETLSVDSAELINEKRSASWGRYTENVKGGYLAVWGDRVQPGGFISAATLSLNVERIESISGAFVENGQDATAALKAVFGERFSQRENEDHTFVDAHVKAGLGAAQVAIMVVAMIVAIYTAGAASGLIASAAESSALAAGMTAAQATAAGVAAASTTSSMMLAGAAGALASSATTQLLSTGRLDAGQMFKAGATGALTAGLLTLPVTGSGESINQLAGITDMAEIGQRLAQFDLQNLGSTLVGMAARGVVNAGVSTAAYGGSFGTAFKYSVVSDLAAMGASAIGQHWGGGQNPVMQTAMHAALGATAARLQGQDAVAGAMGAATESVLGNLVEAAGGFDKSDSLNKTLYTASAMLAGGAAAQAAGRNGVTAATAAQNAAVNNFLGRKDKAERDQLMARKKAGDTLTAAEHTRLIFLDASDQMSDGLLEKYRVGGEAALSTTEKENLSVYLGQYKTQEGTAATDSLIKKGPQPTYGYPYAGTTAMQSAYMEKLTAGKTIPGKIQAYWKGPPKTDNQTAFEKSRIDSGLFLNTAPNESFLPTALKTQGAFAEVNAISNSALATAGYLGATAFSASDEFRRNLTLSLSDLSDIGSSFILPKTSISPVFGQATASVVGGANNIVNVLDNIAPNIHPGQQGKHIPGNNNFIPGRSAIDNGVVPQELLNGVHNGQYPVVGIGSRGQPIVDFGRPIGVDAYSGLPTQYGTIHSGNNGAHIVPTNPTIVGGAK